LLAEVKKTLSADQRKSLVQIAGELGGPTAPMRAKTALLDRIRRALA
jgi:hypothetical protein